jgi:pilus assembly protein Flp/PilA
MTMATLIQWVASRDWFANRDERGQGLVEYALIIALVSIVAIAALILVGGSIRDVLNTIGDCLANPAGCAAPPAP